MQPLLRLMSMLLFMSVTGCSAILTSGPMPERLSPEEQARVDSSWNNAFNPPNRIDRTLLLDVLRTYQLYWHGIDRIDARIEKNLPQGRVVMSLHYDRRLADNESDFIVTAYDKIGNVLRTERYSRADIDERDWLYQFGHPPGDDSKDREARLKAHQDRVNLRMREIRTATQPAGWSDED